MDAVMYKNVYVAIGSIKINTILSCSVLCNYIYTGVHNFPVIAFDAFTVVFQHLQQQQHLYYLQHVAIVHFISFYKLHRCSYVISD